MTMTADELLTIARKKKPHVRYTRNVKGTALAAWKDERWQTVAGIGIDGRWYSVGDLFVNGEPVNPQSEWMPEGN
jgi:hypothetical protein